MRVLKGMRLVTVPLPSPAGPLVLAAGRKNLATHSEIIVTVKLSRVITVLGLSLPPALGSPVTILTVMGTTPVDIE